MRAAVHTRTRAVWYVDAIVAPPEEPAGWQPMVWEYDEVTFIAARASSGALAAALDNDDAQVLPLGCYDLTLPVLAEQVPWQHKPSRARYDSVLLPWPTLIFEPWMPNPPQGHRTPQGYLIGDEATVFGLDGIDSIAARDRLTQLARSIVIPAPDVEARSYELDGKTLIVLTVEPGTDPPYGITLPGKKDKPIEFYVRRDATTFPARPEESRTPSSPRPPRPHPTHEADAHEQRRR